MSCDTLKVMREINARFDERKDDVVCDPCHYNVHWGPRDINGRDAREVCVCGCHDY